MKQRTEARFIPTDWMAVSLAQKQNPEALERLCQTYWNPVYAFVRRWGKSPQDAEDLVQGFFVGHILDENFLAKVQIDGGKFRNFILKSLKYFLLDAHDKQITIKNGGPIPPISFDALAAEKRYLEPLDDVTPDDLFQLRCAQQALEEALTDMRNAYVRRGKGNLYDELESCITGDEDQEGHAERGTRLGMTEDAVKQAAHRLRKEWKSYLKRALAATVTSDELVKSERQDLMALISRHSRAFQARARRNSPLGDHVSSRDET